MKDVLKAVVYTGLFAIPFLTLYVESDYFFPYITGKNFWFRIIVDVVFGAWILLAIYEVKYRPKISGIVWSFGALLVVMFFADLLGVHPDSSFWSNFERMDGYVSLVHTFLYMLVLGSVLQTKRQWKVFLNTSLVVAFAVAFYGLAQLGGVVEGRNRIDSLLGNAAYMAVYMLFHIFIAFWLFVEEKVRLQKILYAALAVLFTFVLLETGTRGTTIGLAVGVLVMSGYISLFGSQFREYRKYAIGGFVILLLVIGGFIAGRDTGFVQNNQNLARIANISLDDLKIRGIIWGTAWEGVKERPLLGYGQSNFNFVFNEYYDPRLYAQEQWFDRAHNIFMDWLVAGGVLGLVAYLSIFGWCLYYLFIRPLRQSDDSFDVMERGVLLGILAGYFTHNLVVFDNIISYIFFAVILALINARVGLMPKTVAAFKIDKIIMTQVVTPVVLLGVVGIVYFWHVPGMRAASDIIDAFSTSNPGQTLAYFKKAIERDSFAYQEIAEQFAQRAMGIAHNADVTDAVRQEYLVTAEEQLLLLAAKKPNDARVYVFIGGFYRAVNQPDKAAEYYALARAQSPNKQNIIFLQGFTALAQSDFQTARAFFREAYELDTNYMEAREYYAGALFYAGEPEAAQALMDSDTALARFAFSEFIVGAARYVGQYDFLVKLYEYRVHPPEGVVQAGRDDINNWFALSSLYYQKNDTDQAISILNESKIAVPQFVSQAECGIDNVEHGREPQENCQ